MIKIEEISKMMDHSILHPTFNTERLVHECSIALKYNAASVCVKPYAIKEARELLNNSDVKVGCVIGFPHGNSSINVKKYEAEEACKQGTQEIDMVINIGKALDKDWIYIKNEIREITNICHTNNVIIKVIIETDYVKERTDKIMLCKICSEARVDYIKTSTGYGFVKKENGDYNYVGATIEDIKLMRQYCDKKVQIKAAGGIRTLDDLLKMKEAGATRIGTTSTEQIIKEAIKKFNL